MAAKTAEYRVTRVLATNVDGTTVSRVPGLVLTLAEIQDIVTNRVWDGVLDTVDIRCDVCGESVADCIEFVGKLRDVPREWSWESAVENPYELEGEDR